MFLSKINHQFISYSLTMGMFAFSFGAQAGDQMDEQKQYDQSCQQAECEPDFCDDPVSTITKLPGKVRTVVNAELCEYVTKTFTKKVEITNDWTDGMKRKQLMEKPISCKFMVDENWTAEKMSEKAVYEEVMRSQIEEDIQDVEISSETYATHSGRVFKDITVVLKYKVNTVAAQRKTKKLSANQCEEELLNSFNEGLQLDDGASHIDGLAKHSRQDARSAHKRAQCELKADIAAQEQED